jgi:hypothetical protein
MKREDWRPGYHDSTPTEDIGQEPEDMQKGQGDLSTLADFGVDGDLREQSLVMMANGPSPLVGRIVRLGPRRALVQWRQNGKARQKWESRENLVAATTDLIAERVKAAREKERTAQACAPAPPTEACTF